MINNNIQILKGRLRNRLLILIKKNTLQEQQTISTISYVVFLMKDHLSLSNFDIFT